MYNFFLRRTFVLMICLVLFPSPQLFAKDNGKEKHLPNPNWVHPGNRDDYPGYAKHKQDKQTGANWQYSTNRDRGNIRGGGTTEYNDYAPFYKPGPPKRKK